MKKGIPLILALCLASQAAGCRQEETQQTREDQILKESEQLAEGYRDIYEAAEEKGILDTPETMGQIVEFLGEKGYAAIDAQSRTDMVNRQKLEAFFQSVQQEESAETVLFCITDTGGFVRYDFQTEQGEAEVLQSALNWKEGEAVAGYAESWELESWKRTENWLFLTRWRPAGFDGPSGDLAFRLEPLEEGCRSACRQYLEPLGYDRNNLFFTDWSAQQLDGVCLEDLYEPLYRMKYREDSRFGFDFELEEYQIPGAELEELYQSFFPVDKSVLREKLEWQEDTETYAYRPRGIQERAQGECPFPEVTAVRENPDGAQTLTVQAVWPGRQTEQAFCHELTVKPEGDGFFYLSNAVLSVEEGVDFSWYTRRLSREEWVEQYGGEKL